MKMFGGLARKIGSLLKDYRALPMIILLSMLTSTVPPLERVKKKLFITLERRAAMRSEDPEDVSIVALNVMRSGLNDIEHLSRKMQRITLLQEQQQQSAVC